MPTDFALAVGLDREFVAQRGLVCRGPGRTAAVRAPGFLEIEIAWHGRGAFFARAVGPATAAGGEPARAFASAAIHGRCAAFDGVVLAACWVPGEGLG